MHPDTLLPAEEPVPGTSPQHGCGWCCAGCSRASPLLIHPYQQHPHCHHGCSTRGDRAVHQDDVVLTDVLRQPQVVELGGGEREQLRGCRQIEQPKPFSLRSGRSLLPPLSLGPWLSAQSQHQHSAANQPLCAQACWQNPLEQLSKHSTPAQNNSWVAERLAGKT